MVLTGDGTVSRSRRRTPRAIAASCSAFIANTCTALQWRLHGLPHRFGRRCEGGEHSPCGIRRGNEVAAQVLWQRSDQGGDELLAQRGDVPRELVAAKAREHFDWHVHGDAVV